MSARLAIDIGGTFTDCVLQDPAGRRYATKTLTTPEDYTLAIAEGIDRLLATSGTAPDALRAVLHATTLGSNTLLERRGARTGLLTTAGFRDVLEIRDLRMPRLYDLDWEKPSPLVPRRWRRVVRERIAADGSVLEPLDEAGARRELGFLRDEGVTSLALCLINAYANPEHELALARLVADEWPEVDLSVSHALLLEAGEYPRTSTTVINAYVKPVMGRYLSSLEAVLRQRGITAPLLLMQSNGGLIPAELAAAAPIHVIESGPAAGVVGAAHVARSLGIPHLLTLDIGGTTAKAAMVEHGEVVRAAEFQVGGEVLQVERLLSGGGFTLRVPAVDLAEVGAGGGSIVALDAAGVPKVGPRSAGADPGPVCYGRGGRELTVTDANLVLGYLDAASLAGGALRLDAVAAEAACAAQLAAPLDLAPEVAAHGAFRLATTTMMQAIRAVTTERGRDPRSFVLLAFGGNGPLFAAAIARALGCTLVLVPPAAGVFSALGLLAARVEVHRTASFRRRLDAAAIDGLHDVVARLTGQAAAALRTSEGDAVVSLRMRYHGQSSDLTVVPEALTEAALRCAFEAAHERVFRFTAPAHEPIEITALEVAYRLGDEGLELRAADAPEPAAPPGRQRAFFGAAGWCDAVVLRRGVLRDAIAGPAILLDDDATILIPPGASATSDGFGNVQIVLTAKAAAA